ncbi:restriction endonuclease subunit S [Leyella stercorea]|uniref:restriction endonuclease subunit S n=1 Tax=Leyella stercorea TaxID=363265 RepID=UPI00242E8764|nr:restriction endonuclease subunit S [Leyella stercorea]
MKYKKYKLGDICKIFGRIGFRGYTTEDLVLSPSDGAISLSPSNIVDGVMDLSKCTYISWAKYEESPEIKIAPNDIVIVKTGNSYGRTAIIRNVEHPMTLNPQFVVLKDIQINPVYLAYFIKTDEFQKQIYGIVGGSAIPTLSQENLANLIVRVPNENIQNTIADILDSLDGKIELNKQINDNLEEQLRLITSRYIFGCPNLEKKRIGEIATVKAGGDCPITFSKTRTQKCNIPIFSNGTEDRGLYGFTNKANIEGHSITVAARGTIGYCERRLMPFVPIIRLLAITPKEDGAYIYLHQVIRGMKFKKNGSVQQQLTVPEISFIEIPYPHSSILYEYNKVASPIVEMIERNISENEILTKQRDELLPLLMNGQAVVNSD